MFAMALQFEWDNKKAQANSKKHGITFEEASTIFSDYLSLTIPDPIHSIGEERFITIGTSIENKLIVVVYTEYNEVIRIISARKATRNEIRLYHQG
jgi:uncharacterized protein